MDRPEALVAILEEIESADSGAFPYADCRKLLHGKGGKYASFVPDLDCYLSALAGYRSWGRRVTSWSEARLKEARAQLESAFFEKFPVYSILQPEITFENVPDLYAALDRAELTRSILLRILDSIDRKD